MDAYIVPQQRNPNFINAHHHHRLAQEDEFAAALVSVQECDGDRASLERLRDAAQSLEYWQEALQVEERLYESCNDLEQVQSLYRQGQLCVRLDRWSDGQVRYQRSLDMLSNKIGDDSIKFDRRGPSLRAKILMGMAGVSFRQGHLTKSLDYLRLAASEWQYLADSSTACDLADCLTRQGMVHRAANDWPAAQKCYEDALQLLLHDNFDSTDAHAGQHVSVQLDLAEVHALQDHTEAALTIYQQLQQSTRIQADDSVHGLVLYSIGQLRSQQGHHDDALQHLQRALPLQESIDRDSVAVRQTLTTMGAIYAVQNKYRAAQDCFQRALLLARMHAAATAAAAAAAADQTGDETTVQLLLRNLTLLRDQSQRGEG